MNRPPRRRAEATANLASGALDQIFQRFTGSSDALADFNRSVDHARIERRGAEPSCWKTCCSTTTNWPPAASSTLTLRQSSVDARFAIGDIHFKLGHYDRAIEAFEYALADSQEIAEPDVRRLRQARIHNRIGLAHRISGDDPSAEEEHLRSLAILTSEAPSTEIRFELARTHYLLAAKVRPRHGAAGDASVGSDYGTPQSS